MMLKDQALATMDALNRRDFAAFSAGFDEEVILDLPDGIRVIGQSSFRDTLAAYVLQHDIRLSDMVVMVDEAGFRMAIECTLHCRSHRGVDSTPDQDAGSHAQPAVIVLEREPEGARFSRMSLFAALRP